MSKIPKDTMKMRCMNIEDIKGINSDEKNMPERTSSHAIFLYDDLDQERKAKIEELINSFSIDKIKISKLGCAPFENGSADEKKSVFLKALGDKVESGEIDNDTIIFMNFHTHADKENLSFSIKGSDKNLRIPIQEVYQYVWSLFTEGEKPSFHNLGCNAGYYAPDLQGGDGHVINYAGKSTISSNENIIQAKEVLRFISRNLNFDNRMPSPERIWHHMESYATQEMSISGKGSYRLHQPMDLPSLKITKHFGHKDPMLLIEYAFRHRPMEQVLKLIEIHDPKIEKISAFSEIKKRRILFHLVPNHVSWINFDHHVVNSPTLKETLKNNDSLEKFLFCRKNNLFPNRIGNDKSDRFLIICCQEGSAKIAKIIFEMPEFSFSENGIKDAFLEAVMSENVEVVKILIEKVSNFLVKDKTSNNIFHFASGAPSSEIMGLLLMPEVLIKFTGGSEAQQLAHRKLLLDKKNNNGVCPLELAIKKQNLETVKLLLEAGADTRGLNSKGNHFLDQAVFRNSVPIVKLLLESRLEVGQNSTDLSRLLRKAIVKFNREIALMLIAHCVDKHKTRELNTQYISGLTPLLLAVDKKDIKLIKALLAAGADHTFTTQLGQNVLHRIAENFYIFQNQLINQELDFSQTKEIVETLISVGVSVNKSDILGNTPLIMAARDKNEPLVKLLLSQRADINAVNKKGYTALHYALEKQDKNFSKYLLENGIDLNFANFNLDSALSLATASNDSLSLKHINAAIEKRKLLNI
jgi:ankyrin repeat protein